MAATDTLIVLSQVGDRLCADVVEPDRKPVRLFYQQSDDLVPLLRTARICNRISVEACQQCYYDAWNAEFDGRHAATMAERERTPESPPANGNPEWNPLAAFWAVVMRVGFSVLRRWGL